jgi:hypothetical protein
MTSYFVVSVHRYQVGEEFRYMVRCTQLPTNKDQGPIEYKNEGGRNFGAIMRLLGEWISERIHA